MPGSTLTAAQIGAYAKQAGFSDKDIPTAVGIAFAESSGNPNAHTRDSDDDSYGLWQINMIGRLGPDRRKWLGLKSDSDLLDPATNARAAKKIKDASGWEAWTTYTSGKYKKYVPGGNLIDDIRKGGPGAALDDFKKGLGVVVDDAKKGAESLSPAEAIQNVGKNLFNGVATGAALFVALGLFIIGLIILTRNTAPVKAVRGAATTVATRGLNKAVKR